MPQSGQRPVQFTPRYILQVTASGHASGFVPRHAVRGNMLFVVLGPDKIAALTDDALQPCRPAVDTPRPDARRR